MPARTPSRCGCPSPALLTAARWSLAGARCGWTGPARPVNTRLLKIDPATGAISAQTTLPAGCTQTAYGLDHVWVLCNATSTYKVLRIDPATAQVDAQTGVLPGPAYTFVAGSEGVWLGTNAAPLQVDPSGTHLTGLKVTGSAKYLSVYSADYIGPLGATELALGDGAVWALAGNVSGQPEHLAEINPVTGRITLAFTYPEGADTSNDYWDLNAASAWVQSGCSPHSVTTRSSASALPRATR